MKYCMLPAVIVCFASLMLSCKKQHTQPPTIPPVVIPPVEIPAPVVYAGYNLIWNDEFNGIGIDLQKWSFETGTGVNGDFGTGQLDRATDRNENIRIEKNVPNAGGGCLAIVTRRESFVDRNYTSARLSGSGKGAWGAGTRIEARIWARDVRYKGQGFAFWMMPAEIPAGQSYIMWPQGGEIDIMEYVGAIPFHNLGSVHYGWAWENNMYQAWNHGHKGAYYSFGERQVPASNPSHGGWPASDSDSAAGNNNFHLYRVDWFSERIEFSIDDHVYHIHYFRDGALLNTAPDGQDQDLVQMVDGRRVMKSEYSNHFPEWSPLEHKFFLLLTAGVGGSDQRTYGGAIDASAVFPCSTFIDWVRVYQRL